MQTPTPNAPGYATPKPTVPSSSGARLSTLVKSVNQISGTCRRVNFDDAYGRRRGDAPEASAVEHACTTDTRLVHQRVLDVLLQPNQSFDESQVPNLANLFTANEVLHVIRQARSLLAADNTLLYIPAPCRVVSDLHGQYADLMRMWGWTGAPDGSLPWVFIGDYVDRTFNGCEVVLLLYSLKIAYPDKIYLLRGNHEISSVNGFYGFQEELTNKWGVLNGEDLYDAVNDSFDYMPLAAIVAPPGYEGEPELLEVEDDIAPRHGQDASPVSRSRSKSTAKVQSAVPTRYMLVHGGIGRLESLSQIASISRPIREGTADQAEAVMHELVWSDPAPSDGQNGLLCSKRDGYRGGIVCFGADRVESFCQRNHITAILRGHECIQEGLEVAFGGRVITFFSAVNYGGRSANHGCILHLALTHESGSLPSIEVQPIRLEARPLPWESSCMHNAKGHDHDHDSDVTELDDDLSEQDMPICGIDVLDQDNQEEGPTCNSELECHESIEDKPAESSDDRVTSHHAGDSLQQQTFSPWHQSGQGEYHALDLEHAGVSCLATDAVTAAAHDSEPANERLRTLTTFACTANVPRRPPPGFPIPLGSMPGSTAAAQECSTPPKILASTDLQQQEPLDLEYGATLDESVSGMLRLLTVAAPLPEDARPASTPGASDAAQCDLNGPQGPIPGPVSAFRHGDLNAGIAVAMLAVSASVDQDPMCPTPPRRSRDSGGEGGQQLSYPSDS